MKQAAKDVDVYFIQAVDGGAIKIGVARRPSERLAELQTGSPRVLVLRGVIPNGGYALEHQLHGRFAKHRRIGEWFEPVPELVELCSANATPEPSAQLAADRRVEELERRLEEIAAAVERHKRGRRGARADYNLYRVLDRCVRRGGRSRPIVAMAEAELERLAAEGQEAA